MEWVENQVQQGEKQMQKWTQCLQQSEKREEREVWSLCVYVLARQGAEEAAQEEIGGCSFSVMVVRAGWGSWTIYSVVSTRKRQNKCGLSHFACVKCSTSIKVFVVMRWILPERIPNHRKIGVRRLPNGLNLLACSCEWLGFQRREVVRKDCSQVSYLKSRPISFSFLKHIINVIAQQHELTEPHLPWLRITQNCDGNEANHVV